MSDLLYLLPGLVGLIVGGEFLVRGAVRAATATGLSPFVIGVTLVGFGTSAPELATSLQAALAGSPGIALGNVIGSNIGNILLILGLAAMLAPLAVDPRALRRDGGVLALSALATLAVVLVAGAGRMAGAALLLGLLVYLVIILRSGADDSVETYGTDPDDARPSPLSGFALAIAGLVVIVLGARWLVTGAVALAELAGLSETVIGLTVVAIGTSLPELVTAVLAARRGQTDVALGNIIGSNIFNSLGILGATLAIAPIEVPAAIASRDIWVMLAATAALIWVAATGHRITRTEGAVLLTGYAGYTAWLLTS